MHRARLSIAEECLFGAAVVLVIVIAGRGGTVRDFETPGALGALGGALLAAPVELPTDAAPGVIPLHCGGPGGAGVSTDSAPAAM